VACGAFAAIGRGPRAAARLRGVALALITVGISVRLGWVLAFDPAWDDGVKKVVLTRLDACAWGLLAAAIWTPSLPDARRARGLALAGLVALALSVLAYRAAPIDTGLVPRVLPFVATGAGFALLLPWLLRLAPARSSATRGVTGLAQASFALYLVHFPWIRLVERDWVHATDWAHGLLHVGVYLACALLSAVAVHRLVERPLLQRVRA
jgi:peptidoglycan/LPS O-acetylase OafA/YrhL